MNLAIAPASAPTSASPIPGAGNGSASDEDAAFSALVDSGDADEAQPRERDAPEDPETAAPEAPQPDAATPTPPVTPIVLQFVVEPAPTLSDDIVLEADALAVDASTPAPLPQTPPPMTADGDAAPFPLAQPGEPAPLPQKTADQSLPPTPKSAAPVELVAPAVSETAPASTNSAESTPNTAPITAPTPTETAPATSTLASIARPADASKTAPAKSTSADAAGSNAGAISEAASSEANVEVDANAADRSAPKIQTERNPNPSDATTGAPPKAAEPQQQAPAPGLPIATAPDLSARIDAPKAAPALVSAHAGAQVAREIVRRFNGDTTTFDLRLDPPELGRVEIRLEVSRDNTVTAIVSADSPQTLTDLARGARDLQNALQAAGLDLTENGLSFDLRQGGRDGNGAQESRPARTGADAIASPDATPVARAVSLDPWRGGAIDLMA
jgi:flagellar hook-length control protein FliK